MSIDFNKWGGEVDKAHSIDFQLIKSVAINHMETILHNWMPGGKLNGHEYVCAGKQGGPGESCSTNINTGVGSDFASGEAWGDPIDLVAKVEGISQSEAARKLTEFLDIDHHTPYPAPSIPTQTPEERYEIGKKLALGLWVESEACPHHHPYLLRKGVNADAGIRLHTPTGNILIPLYDDKGEFWSVQRISPDGEKKINQNGKQSGNFYLIAGDRDIVYVCEGYATAMTVHMVTGKTVVMAINAGNLASVGERISRMFPQSLLVFAADNDQDKTPNPGVKAAQDAVTKIGRGTVIAPPFPVGEKGDWNDYAIVHGASATRELLLVESRRALPALVDLVDFAPTPPKYLIDKLIETPCTGMVVGASGSGKTFVVLDWALCVATGKKWCGREVKQGPVIYVCGEGKHGIPRRTGAWFHKHGITPQRGQFHLTTQRVEINQVSATKLMTDIDTIAEAHGIPTLIIIDTLARSLPSDSDENSANDMQAWINCIDTIRDRYDCTALIVHHTGHADDARGRARGSSALKGAMDLEVLVNKGKGIIECTKGKDMEPWSPIKYMLNSVQVADWSSAVAEFDFNYDPKKDGRNTANRKAAIASLFEAVQADGFKDGKCMRCTWRDLYFTRLGDVTDRSKQRSFKSELTAMEDDGLVKIDGEFVTPDRKMYDDKITSEMFPK